MGNLLEDIKSGSDWTVNAFKALGIDLDYSIKSVQHIEQLLEEQFKNGVAVNEGLFEKGLGGKLFALSSYVGEVIRKNTGNTAWEFDPDDSDNDYKMALKSSGGAVIWPQQKVGKRVQNGSEDNLYFYTAVVVKRFKEESNSIEKGNDIKIDSKPDKPWWKFW